MTGEEFRQFVSSPRFGWLLFGVFVAIEVLIVGACIGVWRIVQ